MKLQEKFENAPIVYDKELNFIKDYESIADDFAIGFAEWVNNNYGKNGVEWVKYIDEGFKFFTIKELLQIYKKEEGL